ncbi:MAG TPA: D-alanine--D-alanine ligase [Saprospiraceae bacterium]|nr:D-alanine--D-alanine ligase [Saprospiraceae bacterium]
MQKIKLAILSGGDSAERGISELSAGTVFEHTDRSKYDARLIDLDGMHWSDLETGTPVDKNNFSIIIDGAQWRPEVIFCAIHGSPMENGLLQGYFDVLEIPYTCCDGFVSALTMNKYLTKQVLRPAGIPLAHEFFLRVDTPITDDLIDHIAADIKLPMFIKPNKNGSSFGVTKVKAHEQIRPAIQEAFRYDTEILCETYLPGREFGNGVFESNGEMVVLPVTEIIPKTEFFTYEAKYEGLSEEITPAEISDTLREKVQEYTGRIYRLLDIKGFARVDYILVEDEFYLLEVNTVPGLSPASIIPQQAIAQGYTLTSFFDLIISEAIRENKPSI